MFATLLLVFREVLEAALIVGIVAAATSGVRGRARLLCIGIASGIAGAFLVAFCAARIANAISGFGQEWFNVTVLMIAVAMIGWHVAWMSKHTRGMTARLTTVGKMVAQGYEPMTALVTLVAIAVLREGSEIVLFGYGLIAGGVATPALLMGATIGLLCGVGVGAALYFGLLRIPMRWFFVTTNWMLVFVASGMSASAAGFLQQANAITALGQPLWNTSWLIDEESITGRSLHVLLGYVGQPTGLQVVFYLGTLGTLAWAMRVMRQQRNINVSLLRENDGDRDQLREWNS